MKSAKCLTFQGETKTVANWAKTLGIKPNILHNRLYQGWSVERTLSTPTGAGRRLDFDGRSQTINEWAIELGRSRFTLDKRLRQGREIGEVLQKSPLPRGKKEKNGRWKGGKSINTCGYVSVYLDDDDPLACMGRRVHDKAALYVLEHRLMMARYLGRPLLSSETVHHINGNRQDNRLQNLQLRIGRHGKGQTYCCAECGSTRLKPLEL